MLQGYTLFGDFAFGVFESPVLHPNYECGISVVGFQISFFR